jgi:colanic acid/amylovoran biosynthesis protein
VTAATFDEVSEVSGKQKIPMPYKRQMRISVLGATFETENMGVSALTAGTIKCILRQHPAAAISLLDYAKQPLLYTLRIDGRETAVPLVNMRFSKRCFQPNNIALLLLLAILLKLIPIQRVREWVLTRNECLRHVTDATLIASIAGGDSFSDIYGIARMLYVGLPQVLVLLLGKPLLLLPQTVGPFRGRFSRILARYILRRALRVYTRDYRSLKVVEALLGYSLDQDRYKFCYDVGFVLDPIAPPSQTVVGLDLQKERGSALVGLNVSGLLSMGGYTRNNAFGLHTDYQNLIYALIDLLIRREGAVVLLVPHVFGIEEGSESDVPACERVFATLRDKYPGQIGLVRGSYNQSEIKYIIGLCDFFVGSRMHACIAAISQNIPAVCIAYSDKFIGVMETIGIGSLVADARKLGRPEIVDLIHRSYEIRAVTHRHLERKMLEVRTSVLNLFAGVPLTA